MADLTSRIPRQMKIRKTGLRKSRQSHESMAGRRARPSWSSGKATRPPGAADMPNPRVGAGDVLARIQAAGVNLLDSSSVTGLQDGPSFRRPLILGIADFQDGLAVKPATLTMAETASVFWTPRPRGRRWSSREPTLDMHETGLIQSFIN
ncbi:hypothetical protein [Streptomyces sp. NPDC127033]|uniref:hypothetical protein n=1 Tax=Streptomyces sp. NPDC127033 TaxID=3347110 RepID=UPI00365C5017